MEDSAENPVDVEHPLERLAGIVAKIESGDPDGKTALRRFFDEHPDLIDDVGDVGRCTEKTLVQSMTQTDPASAEAIHRKVAILKSELVGSNATALEALACQRIVVTWLRVAHADLAFTQNLKKLSARHLQLLQDYQDRAHRRHLAAIKTLAQVRKLLRPQVQVNIARQQINKIGRLAAGRAQTWRAVRTRQSSILPAARAHFSVGPRSRAQAAFQSCGALYYHEIQHVATFLGFLVRFGSFGS